MKPILFLFLALFSTNLSAQINFNFNFANSGQRVCLTDALVSLTPPSVTIRFLDAANNPDQSTNVYRRHLFGSGADWVMIASGLAAGTMGFTDNNVAYGEVWEYQVKRVHGTSFSTGYTSAAIGYDQSNYRGQMILLVADNIANSLNAKLTELKKDLTGDGWLVNELVVPRAYGWDSGDTVVGIRQQIKNIYNNAPANDKPKQLFILGHVPLPRAGLNGPPPDDHIQNKGARGADTYYADIDGVFTDTGTYNPGGLSSPFAINLPGDYKWDQDTIPSQLEMAFGRIDFADIAAYTTPELTLTEQYLDRLHHYKYKDVGYDMGNKTAFYLGYDNSNDGSYRSLPPISGADNVYQNITSLPHPQWVQQNGPFMMYMQNVQAPQTGEWDQYGMDAAIYSSDQSYWGFGDVPEGNQYSKIRSILCANSKCVMAIWTTMAINIFHQAGSGESIGYACKQIMDHNTINQNLEKPSSPYDTPAYWNRTHFELYGDPTIRLHQVYPASSAQISLGLSNSIILKWTASTDTSIAGYNIYKSATEFGKYDRISGNIPVNALTFTDNDPHFGEWYMIRTINLQQTGSGIYLNPSQGIFIQNTITVVALKINSFTASKKGVHSLLQWTTETETNSIGFTIQRSADAINWNDIGFENTKAANGNSNNRLQYDFTDLQPLQKNNYYRLKFVSDNNRFTFSETKKLFFNIEDQFVIAPNPVHDWLMIKNISSNTNNIYSVQLFNCIGKIVYEKNNPVDRIDMRQCAAGIYLIRIIVNNDTPYNFTVIKK